QYCYKPACCGQRVATCEDQKNHEPNQESNERPSSLGNDERDHGCRKQKPIPELRILPLRIYPHSAQRHQSQSRTNFTKVITRDNREDTEETHGKRNDPEV